MTKQINTVFDAPTLSDTTEDIETKAYDTLQKLNPWSQEANALAEQVNQDATTSSSAANAAVESAVDAANSAIIAQTFAGLEKYKGVWGVGSYAQGETVNHKGNYWINDVDGNTEEPGILNWSLVTQSKFEPSVKPTLKFDFARNEAIVYDGAENSFVSKSVTQAVTDGDLVVTNGASNVYDARGRLAPVPFDRARLTFNPETGESEGLLAEEVRANLVTYSEDFSNAVWSKYQVGVASNAQTAPDSDLTADTVESLVAEGCVYQSITVTPDQAYCGSYFVKSNTLDANDFGVSFYDATSGVWVIKTTDVKKQYVGDGWYRVYLSVTTPAGCTNLRFYPLRSDGLPAEGSTSFLWGVQLEKGSFPTSYIPTTTSSVQRVADNVYRDLSGYEFNPYESTVYCEFYRYADALDANPTAFALFDNATGFDDAIYINIAGSFVVKQNGNNMLTKFGQSGLMNEGLNKVTISFNVQANSATAVINGRVINLDNTGVLSPRNLNRIQFGAGNLTFGGLGHSHHGIPITEIYPKELSEAECVALTGGA